MDVDGSDLVAGKNCRGDLNLNRAENAIARVESSVNPGRRSPRVHIQLAKLRSDYRIAAAVDELQSTRGLARVDVGDRVVKGCGPADPKNDVVSSRGRVGRLIDVAGS